MHHRLAALALRAALAALLAALAACATAGGAARVDLDRAHLVDADGARASLASALGDRDAAVLVWWASACPCVARYADRVAALRDRYADAHVAFALVASNADDDAATIAAAHADGRLSLPVLRDPGGRLARELGVISTPTAVIVDRDGRVRFLGWIDNERSPGAANREPWLEDTLDAVLAGEDVARRTPTWGCTITRSLGEASVCADPPATPETAVAPAACH